MVGKAQRSYLTIPWVTTVNSGASVAITLKALLAQCKTEFEGAPWRLLSVKGEAVVIGTTRDSGVGSALFQVRVDTGLSSNVEAINSRRMLVGIVPRSFNLRVPSPNPWKEDEERSQTLIGFETIELGDRLGLIVRSYFEARIEFGPIPYASPKTLGHSDSRRHQDGEEDPGWVVCNTPGPSSAH